jgi:hypothetical protein
MEKVACESASTNYPWKWGHVVNGFNLLNEAVTSEPRRFIRLDFFLVLSHPSPFLHLYLSLSQNGSNKHTTRRKFDTNATDTGTSNSLRLVRIPNYIIT